MILDNGTVFLDPNNDLKISDGVTAGGKNLVKRIQDITVSSGTIISTANSDQDLTITTNGNGDILIGADKNMIFDMNAWNAKGILIQDTQEDGYDDSGTPSTLKVGSIYHETGRMVIESDGAIFSSGVQVDANGNPSENPVYGGLWLTNGQDTGLLIPAQTGTVAGAMSPYVEIHNNEKVWYFRDDGTLSLPDSGNIHFYNNTTLSQGTFDNGTGGQSGISLNCYVGYELNWQGGHLKSTTDNGVTTSNIMCDSPIEFQGSGIDNVEINSSGVTFSDGSQLVSKYPTVVQLGNSSGTINTNASLGDIFDINLMSSSNLANPTNPTNGQSIRWRITHQANSIPVTLGNAFNIPSTATSPLPFSSTSGTMDLLAATYHAGRSKWDIIAFVPGY